MTLKEMSVEYTASANLIRARIRELRAEKKAANSPTASYKIDRRIKELTPILQECRDLAELTARYYERSYHKHERYIVEAEHLKETKPTAYAHEYLGEVTGTGGEVFDNVNFVELPDEVIDRFDRIRRGIDWGYATDPFVYNECHYDKTRRRLYIFRELHQVRLKNRKAAELIKPLAGSRRITCDSAEPKSIDEMRDFGLNVAGAKKGPDSVEYGIKWLQDLEEIIIDPVRCPETAREFSGYELDRDKDGNFKAGFPDHDNHHIDAIRYACEDDMKRPSISILR